jgi:hypothetical protein
MFDYMFVYAYAGLQTQFQFMYWQTYLNQKSHIGLSSLCSYLVGRPDYGSIGTRTHVHTRTRVSICSIVRTTTSNIQAKFRNFSHLRQILICRRHMTSPSEIVITETGYEIMHDHKYVST